MEKERYVVYGFDLTGRYKSISGVITNIGKVADCVKKNINSYHEIRVVNSGDCTVLQFVNGVQVFPR